MQKKANNKTVNNLCNNSSKNSNKKIKITRNNLSLAVAIEQVESYITNLDPETMKDIKLATKNISKAALGAYLSVHTITETLDFMDQIAHSMVDDISENLMLPADYEQRLH